jgi:toxin-antitoxin system PIN domain toxin
VNVVDANVLLYAVNVDADRHTASREWLDRSLSGAGTVGFSWLAMLAFVRLATKIGLFPSPLTSDEAMARLDAWTSQPTAEIIQPTPRHLDLVRSLLRPLGTGGNLVNDAHLAALAVEHRGAVVSYDNDFNRFEGVRWTTP